MKLLDDAPGYTIDTAGLIALDANYRMPGVTDALWADIEKMVEEGRFTVIDLVYEEVLRFQGQEGTWLKNWLKRNKVHCYRELDQESMVLAQKVIRENISTGFLSAKKLVAGQDEADPFLIGHAAVHQQAIITMESAARPNRIPQVADRYGARGIGILEFLKERNFRLVQGS
jgi:hypothetical protein